MSFVRIAPAPRNWGELSAVSATGTVLLLAGASIVYEPRALVLVLLAAGLIAAYAWPRVTLGASLVSVSLYRGAALALSVHVAGFPISITDLLPLPILLAAVSMRMRAGPRGIPPAAWLRRSSWLLACGFVVGVITGVVSSASHYQLLRVVSVEVLLLSGLLGTLIAGDTPAWRTAVRRGVLIAGACAAVQILVSFVYTYATGRSFWLLFPFGSGTTQVDSAIRAGTVNVLRTNDVPTYAMLPAFCVAAFRSSVGYIALAGTIAAAAIVSLSRGFWVAAALVCATLAARHVSARGLGIGTLVRWVAAIGVAAFLILSFAGRVVDIRLHQTLALNDASSSYRSAETGTAFRSLESSPLTFIAGTGAGVTSTKAGLASFDVDPTNASSFLEDSLLSRWTNLSILSPLGAIILLLAASGIGWRMVRLASRSFSDLGLMALCLPATLLGGVVGGTLESQATLITWVLAGTILAGVHAVLEDEVS